MEFFMIKTGFYDVVTEIEAEKIRNLPAEREAFMRRVTIEREDATSSDASPK